MLAQHGRALAAIEATYGVPREIVLAVWGMESNFGANRGRMQIIPSLATLAYDGRRRDWAEGQLKDALDIVVDGRRERLDGRGARRRCSASSTTLARMRGCGSPPGSTSPGRWPTRAPPTPP